MAGRITIDLNRRTVGRFGLLWNRITPTRGAKITSVELSGLGLVGPIKATVESNAIYVRSGIKQTLLPDSEHYARSLYAAGVTEIEIPEGACPYEIKFTLNELIDKNWKDGSGSLTDNFNLNFIPFNPIKHDLIRVQRALANDPGLSLQKFLSLAKKIKLEYGVTSSYTTQEEVTTTEAPGTGGRYLEAAVSTEIEPITHYVYGFENLTEDHYALRTLLTSYLNRFPAETQVRMMNLLAGKNAYLARFLRLNTPTAQPPSPQKSLGNYYRQFGNGYFITWRDFKDSLRVTALMGTLFGGFTGGLPGLLLLSQTAWFGNIIGALSSVGLIAGGIVVGAIGGMALGLIGNGLYSVISNLGRLPAFYRDYKDSINS